ncbi:hypothetical protein [Mesorhizobium sp. M1396]|uniref:hypothetical protein n=1 Tax=Mesorhizobium sp. M1396 TaxID=2957095 RepID=UPI003334B6B4
MPPIDFITIGNPRRIKTILTGVVDQIALDAIEEEIKRNTQQLFDLALYHYRFATPRFCSAEVNGWLIAL